MEKVKFSVITYGCSFNQRDSEVIIANLLRENKYNYVEDYNKADLVVVNTCSVKNLAETKAFRKLRELEILNKKVVVAGCIPQAEPSYLNTKLKDYSVIGVNDLDKINEVAKVTLNGKVMQVLSNVNFKHLCSRRLSRVFRLHKNIEVIPINEGCMSKCTYCKTKFARGNLFSYPIERIKEAVEYAVFEGVKEIWITSQDVACYGFDKGTNLVELLKSILEVKGDYKIRIGMGNPQHFIKIIDELLDIIENEDRIYKFLHIPLQSGSDRILKEMRRGNTVEEYINLVNKIRKKLSNITLANDIIVAYPTETEEEFLETVNVIKKTKPSVLNVSRFWLRPGTDAEKFYSSKDFIDGKESKRRSKVLLDVFNEIAFEENQKLVGWQGEVLINENGKNNSLKGRNLYYKQIIIPFDEISKYKQEFGKDLKIGDVVKVRIEKASSKDFFGKILF